MRCKIVRFQKLMWRNMMKSTKSKKTSVLHYSIDAYSSLSHEACVFGKWFTKKLDVNPFSNFNKGFSDQRKLFSV